MGRRFDLFDIFENQMFIGFAVRGDGFENLFDLGMDDRMRFDDISVPFDAAEMLFSVAFVPFAQSSARMVYDIDFVMLFEFEDLGIVGDFEQDVIDLDQRDKKAL